MCARAASRPKGWSAWAAPLLLLVQLAASCHHPLLAGDLQAEKIYAWEFQRSEDRNLDQWPDGWRRRSGRNFPSYIPVRIAPRDPEAFRIAHEAEPLLSRAWVAYQSGQYWKQFIPESTPEPIARFIDRFAVNSCLMVDMDGGAVELESPPLALDKRFTYTLDVSLSTQGLTGHRAWVELVLYDQTEKVVSSGSTAAVTGNTDWQVLTTKSLTSEALHCGRVILHIDPLKSRQLSGRVNIDEIRLYRMPKLELTVDAPHHVASPNQLVDITCTVLGVHDARSSVNFKLIDHLGQVTAHTVAPLVPMPPPQSELDNKGATPNNAPMLTAIGMSPRPASTSSSAQAVVRPQHIDGVARWQLRVSEPGYYRVVVDLGRTQHNTQSRQISREASLAIVTDSRVGVSGPFGWSLPDFNSQFTPEVVPELVKLGGVGWLKVPVWFDPRDLETAKRLSLLLERLDVRKVNCVGLLDQPLPADGQAHQRAPAAAVFSSPDDWEPQLEPALTRMSMKLTWFQLGRDDDRSFVGNPTLIPLVTDIRNRMQTYTQELQLALSWDYQDPLPDEKNLPWRASQMASEPQLTARELKSYLSTPDKPGQTRWVTLNPLPASRYRVRDRARDLTERMITIKQQKVEAAFVTKPLEHESGIFNPDGSVGDLFIPWRLLNRHLATANYIGSINMPGGSTNYIFSEGDTGFMLLWNDRTAVEQLYLGDNIQATDLWGRPLAVENTRSDRNAPEQKLKVTAWPILVTGISVPVANWRMRFKLGNSNLPSSLAQRTELPITVENTLSGSVYGTVTLHAPSLLHATGGSMQLQLSSGQQQQVNLPVPLRNDASAGKHSLRFDFQLAGDRDYFFSVYDSLTLGIGDVELLWETLEITAEGASLRVEIINRGNRPVSFDCKLFPLQQPYRRFQITEAPPGHSARDMFLPLDDAPADSVLWIRCEELGMGRVLNYRVPLTAAAQQ